MSDFIARKLARICKETKAFFKKPQAPKLPSDFVKVGPASLTAKEIERDRDLKRVLPELIERMPVYRRVAAEEGNSFYRAFGFSLFETLFFYSYSVQETEARRLKYRKWIDTLIKQLDELSFCEKIKEESLKNEDLELRNLKNVQIFLSDCLVLLAEFCIENARLPYFATLLSEKLEDLFNRSKVFDFGAVLFIRVLALESWWQFIHAVNEMDHFKMTIDFVDKNLSVKQNIEIYGAPVEESVLIVLAYNLKIKLHLFYLDKSSEGDYCFAPKEYCFDSRADDILEIPIFYREGNFEIAYIPYTAFKIHENVFRQFSKKDKVGQNMLQKLEQSQPAGEDPGEPQNLMRKKTVEKVQVGPFSLVDEARNRRRTVANDSVASFGLVSPFEEDPLKLSVKPAKATIDEQEVFSFNEVLKNLVNQLKDEMPVFRSIRGDGNCFYRALGFSLLETFYFYSFSPQVAEDTRLKIMERLKYLVEKLSTPKLLEKIDYRQLKLNKEAKNPEFVRTKLLDLLYLLVEFCEVKKAAADFGNALSQKLQDLFNCVREFDLGMTLYIRSLAEEAWQAITSNEKFDTDLREMLKMIESHSSTRKDIKMFGTEAEEAVIVVIAHYLKIFVKVNYLEKNQKDPSNPKVICKEFGEMADPEIVIYFRPGHYDAGYSKFLASVMHPRLLALGGKVPDLLNDHDIEASSGARSSVKHRLRSLKSSKIRNPDCTALKSRIKREDDSKGSEDQINEILAILKRKDRSSGHKVGNIEDENKRKSEKLEGETPKREISKEEVPIGLSTEEAAICISKERVAAGIIQDEKMTKENIVKNKKMNEKSPKGKKSKQECSGEKRSKKKTSRAKTSNDKVPEKANSRERTERLHNPDSSNHSLEMEISLINIKICNFCRASVKGIMEREEGGFVCQKCSLNIPKINRT